MRTKLLTVDEVVERTRLARSTVYKLAASGQMPSQKLRRRLLFPEDRIEEWIRNGGEVVSAPVHGSR